MEFVDCERAFARDDGDRRSCRELLLVLEENVEFNLEVFIARTRWPDGWCICRGSYPEVMVAHTDAVFWVSVQLGDGFFDAVENGIILVWRGFELVRVPVPFVEECRIGGLYEESEPANLAMVAPECLV